MLRIIRALYRAIITRPPLLEGFVVPESLVGKSSSVAHSVIQYAQLSGIDVKAWNGPAVFNIYGPSIYVPASYIDEEDLETLIPVLAHEIGHAIDFMKNPPSRWSTLCRVVQSHRTLFLLFKGFVWRTIQREELRAWENALILLYRLEYRDWPSFFRLARISLRTYELNVSQIMQRRNS